MKYGLWIEDAGRYKGWFGLTSASTPQGTLVGGKLVPWIFDTLDGAEKAAANYLCNRPCATVEVKAEPPEELPWNEAEWQKAKQ